MCPRSGILEPKNIKNHNFLLPDSTPGKGLFEGNSGTGEHLPKPPFWKPPFSGKHPSSRDVLEPLKQALWHSHDVTISSQFCGSNAQKVFFHIR